VRNSAANATNAAARARVGVTKSGRCAPGRGR
jgi:hypothetical protein